jgi:zinc protease
MSLRFSLGAAVAVVAMSSAARADDLRIPFTTSQLPNGLTVILHEDHTIPTVVVNVSYGTGSRMEQPKRTGFAHLFEHLMFMGTRRVPTKAFDGWMEAAGGWNNAWTSEDRTDFFDVGPPTSLDLLLWLEADRLRDLGPLMTLDKLNAQRDVVRNERRQTTENTPYGKVELRLPELLYPEGHPYHHPVIGSHEDLESATVDDVKQFFATWYDPANASLVVAGDFEPKAALEKVQKAFGSIPSRGKPKDPGAPGFDSNVSTLSAVVRETMRDDVELPKVVMAWQSPKHFAAGDAELDLLSSVLAGGKGSRLYQTLVYDQKLAQSVDAYQSSGTLGSRFVVGVLARPGVSLDKIETAVDKELAKARAEKVTDEELSRAKNGYESQFVRGLEGVRQRASILNLYQAELADPGYVQKDLDRYRKATADGIKDVAARVLDPNKRVVLRVLPREKKPDDGKPAQKEGKK